MSETLQRQDGYLASLADIERITGITFKTIQKRLKDIKPTKIEGIKKLYPLDEVLPLVFRINNQADFDLSQERAKLARAQTEKIEIEIKKHLEKLVDKEAFMEDFQKSFASLKESLLQLGDSVAQEIVDTRTKDKDAVSSIINDRIHEFLEEVASEHA